MKPREGAEYLKYYESVLNGYTYLNPYKDQVKVASLDVTPLTTASSEENTQLSKEGQS